MAAMMSGAPAEATRRPWVGVFFKWMWGVFETDFCQKKSTKWVPTSYNINGVRAAINGVLIGRSPPFPKMEIFAEKC